MKRRNGKRRHASRVLVSLLVLGLMACEDRTPPEPQDQTIRPARIFTVADQSQSQNVSFVGRVEALQTIDISFEVGGSLATIPVLEGQDVAKGQLLAALDDTDFVLAVREAEVQVKLARQDLERKRSVLQQRGIARSLVDDAQAMYELQGVRLDQAKERLDKSKLLSPFGGAVARRYVDNFVNIQPNTPVIRLQNLSKLLVVAHVPQILLATASEEQVIEMYATFSFAPERKFPLAIHENRGEADSVAQTYEISLLMDRPTEWNVLPGMSATVYVSYTDPQVQTARYIPVDAIVTNPDKSFYVWVFDQEDSSVTKRNVEVGPPASEGIPVLSGLSGGEKIVATGAEFLQVGMKVRPLTES